MPSKWRHHTGLHASRGVLRGDVARGAARRTGRRDSGLGRSLGEFGPVQVFAGAIPGRTVVLPTAIYFEQELGRLDAALAVSLVMVALAACVLVLTRILGLRDTRAV